MMHHGCAKVQKLVIIMMMLIIIHGSKYDIIVKMQCQYSE